MGGRADTGRTGGDLVRIGLGPFDQAFEVGGRKVLAGHQQLRIGGDGGQRLEIVENVELQRIDGRINDVRAPVTDADRVAVRCRAHDTSDAQRTGGSRGVFDDHRLAERPAHPLRQDTRQRVGRTAGGERHHQCDRLGRKGLGAGAAGGQGRGQHQAGDEFSPHARLPRFYSGNCPDRRYARSRGGATSPLTVSRKPQGNGRNSAGMACHTKVVVRFLFIDSERSKRRSRCREPTKPAWRGSAARSRRSPFSTSWSIGRCAPPMTSFSPTPSSTSTPPSCGSWDPTASERIARRSCSRC